MKFVKSTDEIFFKFGRNAQKLNKLTKQIFLIRSAPVEPLKLTFEISLNQHI